MEVKTVVMIRVHDGEDYSYSSNDYQGYKTFPSGKEADAFIKENKFEVSSVEVDDDCTIKLVYLRDYAHNKRRNDVEKLFTEGMSEDANAYWKAWGDKRNKKRAELGYIYCKDKMTYEDYLGNLNKSLTDYVKGYINSGLVCGYLGHGVRKADYDTIVEKVVDETTMNLDNEPINKWKYIGMWLTSSDARHWMDNFEDEDIDNEGFERSFREKVNTALTLGFVYSLDEHQGTFLSTCSLMDEYRDRITFSKE